LPMTMSRTSGVSACTGRRRLDGRSRWLRRSR